MSATVSTESDSDRVGPHASRRACGDLDRFLNSTPEACVPIMKKLGWGLIGCGDIARKRIAPALRDLDQCDLVAVSRGQSELAESFAKEFGARKWFGAWSELLRDSEIEAVYIATPVHLHAEHTIAAAEAGKHVLCEKPLAMNPGECDRMMAACHANKVTLGVAYYRHFYPVIERTKEIIQSGEIGEPVLAQINAFEYFNPEADNPRHWLLEKNRSGGGPMFDFGCHRIEVLVNILGPITKVKAITSNVLFGREVEDTATALFQFERGTSGVLSISHAAREAQDTLEIFGSRGSIRVPVLNKGTMQVTSDAGERIETHPPDANLHAPLIRDFTEAVMNDRAPAVGGDVGRMVATIEEEIYQHE